LKKPLKRDRTLKFNLLQFFHSTHRRRDCQDFATGFHEGTLQFAQSCRFPRIRTVNPHRFRDTLAISLLQADVAIEDVKEILGHEDVNITLKHYGNWVKARQDRLNRSLESPGVMPGAGLPTNYTQRAGRVDRPFVFLGGRGFGSLNPSPAANDT
jgi:integrase